MPVDYYYDAGGYVDRDEASLLFPVDGLSAAVYQYRDAELALEAAAREDVVVVAPTGFASSYALGQHTLTAIEVEGLPDDVLTRVSTRSGDPLADYELVQVGRNIGRSENRSLAEFSG